MSRNFEVVKSVPVPAISGITRLYEVMNLADAYAILLPAGTSSDPELLVRFILSCRPRWIEWLIKIRDTLVGCFGLKTAKDLGSSTSKIGVFNIYSSNEMEILLGADDKHLDFRISILCSDETMPEENRHLIFSTVVHCHNRVGRAYVFIIAPFHRLVVKASLIHAARIGWPKAASSCL
ncbi:DUF2867 domain-containing protein [Pseudomonas sp. NGC7]|uniref:DUF2867 domain-containing protein n=1 Tax=Pseudomonas sp. NGC7 TaxID=3341775 RepID=UPI00399CECC9